MSTRLKVKSGQTLLFVNVPTVSFALLWLFYTIGSCDGLDKYQLWLQLVWKREHVIYKLTFLVVVKVTLFSLLEKKHSKPDEESVQCSDPVNDSDGNDELDAADNDNAFE